LTNGRQLSEIELQCELNQPWIITRRDDAPEVAGIIDLPCVLVNGGGGIEVADGVVEVDLIEQVEVPSYDSAISH
jgi:hypothetical protein